MGVVLHIPMTAKYTTIPLLAEPELACAGDAPPVCEHQEEHVEEEAQEGDEDYVRQKQEVQVGLGVERRGGGECGVQGH